MWQKSDKGITLYMTGREMHLLHLEAGLGRVCRASEDDRTQEDCSLTKGKKSVVPWKPEWYPERRTNLFIESTFLCMLFVFSRQKGSI